MTRILVTGASGFIGRHCLLELAARGHDVHAVSSKELEAKEHFAPQVRWHRTDLLEAAQIARQFPLCQSRENILFPEAGLGPGFT